MYYVSSTIEKQNSERLFNPELPLFPSELHCLLEGNTALFAGRKFGIIAKYCKKEKEFHYEEKEW